MGWERVWEHFGVSRSVPVSPSLLPYRNRIFVFEHIHYLYTNTIIWNYKYQFFEHLNFGVSRSAPVSLLLLPYEYLWIFFKFGIWIYYYLYITVWMWIFIIVGIYLFAFLSFPFQDLSQFQAGSHCCCRWNSYPPTFSQTKKSCQNNPKLFVVSLFKICPSCCRLQAHWQWENFSQQLQFSTLCCFCLSSLYLLLDTTL